MEDIAFNDWPTMDVGTGTNSWFPAYGFQTSIGLIEREDFLGNPDAEYFLHSTSTPCLYLETIHEETSDDLRSDSDVSRGSPLGWLASDSDADSVICMDANNDTDCESDREIACPIKRRRQDNLLVLPIEEEYQSLSRSSSLLQFETLEKQCQETSSSSPSIYSQFSFDSIDGHRKNILQDSNNNNSDGSDTGGSETTLAHSTLKAWHSFESLPRKKDKISVESLSEDSGYSDHMSMKIAKVPVKPKTNFGAYDCDVFQQFTGNFGASRQNLSIFEDDDFPRITSNKQKLILEKPECVSKYTASSASVPDLLVDNFPHKDSSVCTVCSVPKDLDLIVKINSDDWNGTSTTKTTSTPPTTSIAVKNWDLADFTVMANYKREGSYAEAMRNRIDLSDDEHSLCYKKKPPPPQTTIEVFDRKILNAISESFQSLNSNSVSSEAVLNKNFYVPQTRNVSSTVSTPNLALNHIVDTDLIEEDRRRSVQDIPRNSISTTSGMSDIDDKTLCEGSSTRGVHFSPVVSEVNWRDDSTTTTAERESSYSLSSTPERETAAFTRVLLGTPPPSSTSDQRFSSQPELNPLNNISRLRSQSQPEVNQAHKSLARRRGSQLIKKDKDGTVVKAYIDGDGIQYKHTHLDLNDILQQGSIGSKASAAAATTDGGSPPLPSRSNHVSSITTTGGNVGTDGRTTTTTRTLVGGMEAAVDVSGSGRADARRSSTTTNNKTTRTAKLGGFFSRLASFRFSNKQAAEKKAKKKNNEAQKSPTATGDAVNSSQQRIATKDDYIYIPLKGPIPEDVARHQSYNNNHTNNNHSANHHSQQQQQHLQQQQNARKPPLPRAPPRVVGASVKRNDSSNGGSNNAHSRHPYPHNIEHQQQQHRRRRTIDSGESCPRPMEPMGLIETDLDTEVTVITSGANVKTRSLLNLGAEPRLGLLDPEGQRRLETDGVTCHTTAGRPHKSMEFLLDKQNLKVVEPPENELQKGERVMSEHQLRVQRSLQKLTVPDWYKQSQIPREGFLLKKSTNRETRWTGVSNNNKTTSLSSLGSNTQSPMILSPTAGTQPFVRWSTSKLNSTASSPCASTRSSFNARQPNGSISPSSVRSSFSYRQPYLGWRSQERLTRPRTPAERLANSLLNQPNQAQHQVQESPEIQTSIKEVTSAIVHYVSGLKPESSDDSQRSRSASPRGSQKLCWLESSFVGIRPLDSPQTPVGLGDNQTPAPPTSLRLELQTHNDVKLLNTASASRPSPGSTTLEDVLDSLLGLPSSDRAPSPSLQVTASANTSPSRLAEASRTAEQFRRRSEGNEPAPMIAGSRRVSFQSSPVLQCRYSRCGRTVPASSTEATSFKNCHNCSYTYCSRTCRRAHWEKHRKTCLFSRIGSLCRQVIAAVKERKDTLHHLSTIARRGYLSHGAGAVKCFFPCPEAAEKFLTGGLSCLGELTYVRWPDLLPSEMGPQLYTEIVQMCKTYNPDTKLVLYVSVCVVSETPASGAVKWERQLVSRCAKMRLSKDISVPDKDQDNPETLILTCNSIEGNDDRTKQLKERTITNVQKQLKRRGVSLRRQHPIIFKQLCAYAEGNCEKFTPITVYPKDSNTGKSFMCIIMLEADPDSLRQVELAGVKVRTVDVLCD